MYFAFLYILYEIAQYRLDKYEITVVIFEGKCISIMYCDSSRRIRGVIKGGMKGIDPPKPFFKFYYV